MRQRVRWAEIWGLTPVGESLRQCWSAIAGDAHAPPSRFGLSSLRILKPRVSVPLWLGRTRGDRRAWIYNFVNRCPAPVAEGYSVRVTYARDYRGGRLTYDGHVGTDFAIPAGTEVVAAAPGIVFEIRHDMQRGGLKVCVDHGGGVITTSGHLSRALVSPGQRVARGEVIALSGMSGVDGLLFSPWLAPHVHLNVLLDGKPVDPFATADETSLWRTRNDPTPSVAGGDEGFEPTTWSGTAVDEGIRSCSDPAMRSRLESVGDANIRAAQLVTARLFFPHRFAPAARTPVVATPNAPAPLLDLPFSADDFAGAIATDDPNG